MSFRHFDTLVEANEFWTMPIERINQNLERNHKKDTLQRAGISAVVGCPFPQKIQEKILSLEQVFMRTLAANGSKARVEWRKNDDALHFSVYGLVLPDDYQPGDSWPLRDDQMKKIREALHSFGNAELQLQGIGILGMGAVSVRVSDAPELEQLRDAIGKIGGISGERFGSRTKKIVIGRISPPLTAQDREWILSACEVLKDYTIGTLRIDSLEIVHYKNTFLEQESERITIE